MPQRNIHVIISLLLLLFCSLKVKLQKNKGKRKRNIEYKVENESLVCETIIYCVLKNINLINNI